MRVVDQLLAGNGPVWNAGERVEAATSPAWLWVLTVGELLPGLRLEWFAVVVGLGCSVFGLWAAERAALALVLRRGSRVAKATLVPVGALVVVALPPFWDFATSGLETGLVFAWLGGSAWALTSWADRTAPPGVAARSSTPPEPPAWLPVLLGLGPLLRPDLALFSITFLVALGLIPAGRAGRSWARLVARAAALPVLYQVFRMGYYGLLVPNTAVSKEATASWWSQGLRYLEDFADPYHLWWALVPVGLLLALVVRSAWTGRDRASLAITASLVGAGLLHALFITRMGGDFMHGRLLLPATFALLVPVAVVAVDRAFTLVLTVVVLTWSIVAGTSLRVEPSTWGDVNYGIVDERAYWSVQSRVRHPVVIEDYAALDSYALVERIEDEVARGERPFYLEGGAALGNETLYRGRLRNDVDADAALSVRAVGVPGYRAGPDIQVVDPIGLGDAIASHIRQNRFRPGHLKVLPEVWIAYRYADLDSLDPPVSITEVALVRTALECSRLRELRDAIDEPLTPVRFLANLIGAPARTTLRYPADPAAARLQLCY